MEKKRGGLLKFPFQVAEVEGTVPLPKEVAILWQL